jgi:hypothetical protein
MDVDQEIRSTQTPQARQELFLPGFQFRMGTPNRDLAGAEGV